MHDSFRMNILHAIDVLHRFNKIFILFLIEIGRRANWIVGDFGFEMQWKYRKVFQGEKMQLINYFSGLGVIIPDFHLGTIAYKLHFSDRNHSSVANC